MSDFSTARLRRDNLVLLHMHKGGLGDAFCLTGLMRALRAKNQGVRFIVVTRYPAWFEHLPDVAELVDLARLPARRRLWLSASLRLRMSERVHDFVYKPQRQVPKALCDAHPDRRPHLVELAAERLRLPADFSDVRGRLVFSDTEHRLWSEKYAELDDFAVVVPAGKTSYTPNKEWGFGNYAAVVASLSGVRWVQLGLPENPPLPGALDLRGKTGLREMAWLLSRARFSLCGEGLHNHLCGALGTPCFVVFSGFHYPQIARYPATHAILADEMPPCAPCWLKAPCPVPGKPCTARISPARVVARIRSVFGDIA